MSRFKANLVSGLLSKGWTMVMLLAFVPVYVRLLGVEAYGIITLYSSLSAILVVLDGGLGATFTREIARAVATNDGSSRARDLTRSMEAVYWLVALVVLALGVIVAPGLLASWVKPSHLPVEDVTAASRWMFAAIALQLPSVLYIGGLNGLEEQVLANSLAAASATLRWLGAALVVSLVAPTLQLFFMWHAAVAAAHSVLALLLFWHRVPAAPTPARVRLALLRGIRRLALGTTGITTTGIVLTQMDKIILSKLLPLREFGYYGLAWAAASGLGVISVPFFVTSYPRMSALAARADEPALAAYYHHSSRLLASLLLPVAIVMATFPREVLMLWTEDPRAAQNAYLVLTIISAGCALNGLMIMPYALQLAYAWTRLGFVQNLLGIAVLLPLTVFGARAFGPPGAAAAWLLLNLSYIGISVQLMHRRCLPDEKTRWYLHDVGVPLLGAALVVSLARWALPTDLPRLSMALALAAVTAAAGLAAAAGALWGDHAVAARSVRD
jgi:O-antigen/teichoic acid export membrane protein